jgi:predicted phage terminase large subunit-like protein
VAHELGRRHLLDYLSLVVPEYQRANHVATIAAHLEAVERGEITRLLIDAPPRHSKSLTVAQGFASWYLGRHPRHEVIVASYGQELSDSHSRRARGFAQSDRWPFEARVSEDSHAVSRWHLDGGGGMRAVGVGGSITGHGAHVLILDDLIRGAADAASEGVREAAWRWLREDALTRLQPGGAVVAVGTRWHEDDPLGRLLASSGEWTHLHLPALSEGDSDLLGRPEGDALWPEWFDEARLHELRVELGTRAFAALYQGSPTPDEGATFKREWLTGTYAEPPEGAYIVCGVDASYGDGVASDLSAVVTVAVSGAHFYVLDVSSGRWDFNELHRRITMAHEKWKPSAILVEDTGAGKSAVQEFRRTSPLPVVPVSHEGASKVARAESVTGLFEAGRVLLPAHDPGWRDDLIEELASFPAGKHDDRVDGLVYALRRLKEKSSSGAGVSGVVHHTRRGLSERERERRRREYVSPREADD